MKFATLVIASTVLSLATHGLPMGQGTEELAVDKRDLHDLCGRWFCGHTKRDNESSIESSESSSTKHSTKGEE
ncbi:hypothetical protein K7432_015416 [Basidiobolus ranarum]|uniref:Uncharacterized protein n=1 Tax=Basidiobolus ranarum TaxID=34480 RepID=A0ABR2VN34_9FUNG